MKTVEREKGRDPAVKAPLLRGTIAALARNVPEWSAGEDAIEREFEFRDFREAMDFVNRVAELAEREDHYPDICISFRRVSLRLSTHTAGGLTMRDFTVAERIDKLVSKRPGAASEGAGE